MENNTTNQQLSNLSERSRHRSSASKDDLLVVEDLSVSFVQYESGLKQRNLEVICDLNVSVKSGEIVAIVGSSGSGKSLLAHAILGILPSNAKVSGTMMYQGKVLTSERQKAIRGSEISLIPQSVNYLDPLMKVGEQVQNTIKTKDAKDLQQKIFTRYQLSTEAGGLYPFQLSGGMARRVLVATAVSGGARLIIADEPTPGLHPEVVAETLSHLKELANQGCGVLMITHDIEAAMKIADRIAVFYAGTTVEVAPIENFKNNGEALRHPYTKALWMALPENDFKPIPGFQPTPADLPSGCLFEPRCQLRTAECRAGKPKMADLRGGQVRCIHAT
ncbi:ABC transporter ATP-binding protein [Acetobacterium sp.]|uniref:ABC transporter ATP-binding protein n=1 Tax=Acetobacterium sp. TaxID=1872094 RepID=UPI003593D607